jgi:hypothetical protein
LSKMGIYFPAAINTAAMCNNFQKPLLRNAYKEFLMKKSGYNIIYP